MTAPPLPAIPCLRVRLDYTQSDGFRGGNRFFFSYSGAAPSGANCTALAGSVATAWAATVGTFINGSWALTEVDVLDIATDSGLSGQWTGNEAGTGGTDKAPSELAVGVEFDIARRYRGGKPRCYWPPSVIANLADPAHWNNTLLGVAGPETIAFFAAVEGLTEGTTVVVDHVNLSYYKGFTNVTNSSGRTRAAPSYRATALVDTIEGYTAKAEISSQKRRRLATSY